MSKKGDVCMSHSLKYETFGSLLKNVVDNRGKTCPITDSGMPLIATNCIVNDYLYPLLKKVRYVTKETYNTSFRGHPKPGDMLFVLKGTPGRVAWVSDPVDFCIAQDMVAIRADESKIFPKYLFAVLRSDYIQQEIEGLHVGSLIPHFKKGDFNDLKIPIVEPKLQEFIGNQYFDLSLKIDLLHRQNQTLEAMAETLFRQWFVEEADEGWEEKPLSFYGNIVCGKTPSKKVKKYFDGEIPFIKIPDMHGNVFLFDTVDSLTEAGKLSQPKKTLPPKSICVSCIATVGLVSFNIKESQTNQQINSIVPHEDYYRYYLYFVMCLSYDLLHAMASGGTATLNLNTGDFSKIPVLYPSQSVLVTFHKEIEPLFNKIFLNQSQIRTLEKMRDTLLPKLMSGEVRVKI